MTRAFVDNKLMLSEDPLVFEGDTYCSKHQELLTLGLEVDANGKLIETCGYCEWEMNNDNLKRTT